MLDGFQGLSIIQTLLKNSQISDFPREQFLVPPLPLKTERIDLRPTHVYLAPAGVLWIGGHVCLANANANTNGVDHWLGGTRGIYSSIILVGGGIKPVHLGKNGEENWYIRTFFHIFMQKRVDFIIFLEILAQKCNKK